LEEIIILACPVCYQKDRVTVEIFKKGSVCRCLRCCLNISTFEFNQMHKKFMHYQNSDSSKKKDSFAIEYEVLLERHKLQSVTRKITLSRV